MKYSAFKGGPGVVAGGSNQQFVNLKGHLAGCCWRSAD
jgi:hypothetical protein